MQETMDSEEVLKQKRIKLLNELLDNMQLAIRNNNIKGEIAKKIYIYSRIADYTNYSEVSIRKFLTGAIPKDMKVFLNGIIQYGTYLKMQEEYLLYFAREYATAASVIVIGNIEKTITKNNLMIQDVSKIVRNGALNSFVDSFINESTNMCYIYGYRLCGKTISVMAYMYDFVNRTTPFGYVIWNDIRDKNAKKQILENVLKMEKDNLNDVRIEEEMQEELCMQFLEKNKSVIIVDLGEEKLETKMIEFLKQLAKYEEELSMVCKEFSMDIGMTKSEIKTMLELYEELKTLTRFREDVIDIVYSLTGGFPFATLYICKKIVQENKYGESLDKIIQHYREFNDEGYEGLSTKIIDESWEEISELAHQILMICASFKRSVSLSMVANLCNIKLNEKEWAEALKECYDRGLLNHIILNHPRCNMNIIIRTLILSKMKKNKNFDYSQFYERLAKYYIEVSASIGECYNDLEKMKILDEKDEFEIVQEAMEMLYYQEKYEEYIAIDCNLKYYIYTRGYWKIGEESSRLKRARLGKILGDKNTELEGYCDYINNMSKQKNKEEASKYLKLATKIVEEEKEHIQKRILCLYYHVQALYLYSCCEQYQKAYDLWQKNETEYISSVSEYRHLVHQLWLDKCRVKLEANSIKAEEIIQKHIQEAEEKEFMRGVIDYYLLLINLRFDKYDTTKEEKHLKQVEEWLKQIENILRKKSNQDIRNEAEFYRLSAILSAYRHYNQEKEYYCAEACKLYKIMSCVKDIEKLKAKMEQIEKEEI